MTADSSNTYIYDAWNRLVEVRDRATDALIAEYEYDGQKRRISSTTGVSPVTDDYFYNSGWQLIETRTADDADPAEQYVWDLRYIDAPVLRFQDGNTDGDYADAEDSILYYTNDANMNVTALADESGAVVERYAYDPYGQVTVLDADWSTDADNASDVANEVLYAGYRFDPETGLFHVRNRYYSTSLGRFISRDPLGYVDGMSVYEYVGSGPVSYVDSEGTDRYVCGWGHSYLVVPEWSADCCEIVAWWRYDYQLQVCGAGTVLNGLLAITIGGIGEVKRMKEAGPPKSWRGGKIESTCDEDRVLLAELELMRHGKILNLYNLWFYNSNSWAVHMSREGLDSKNEEPPSSPGSSGSWRSKEHQRYVAPSSVEDVINATVEDAEAWDRAGGLFRRRASPADEVTEEDLIRRHNEMVEAMYPNSNIGSILRNGS
jgi:RHS repeat-associated protein